MEITWCHVGLNGMKCRYLLRELVLPVYPQGVAPRQSQHLKDARAALEKRRADTPTTRYYTWLFVMPDNVVTWFASHK